MVLETSCSHLRQRHSKHILSCPVSPCLLPCASPLAQCLLFFPSLRNSVFLLPSLLHRPPSLPQLSSQGAIVTRLASIEEMAGMNMLCSDKTGTLTLNKMVIQDDCPIYTPGVTKLVLSLFET